MWLVECGRGCLKVLHSMLPTATHPRGEAGAPNRDVIFRCAKEARYSDKAEIAGGEHEGGREVYLHETSKFASPSHSTGPGGRFHVSHCFRNLRPPSPHTYLILLALGHLTGHQMCIASRLQLPAHTGAGSFLPPTANYRNAWGTQFRPRVRCSPAANVQPFVSAVLPHQMLCGRFLLRRGTMGARLPYKIKGVTLESPGRPINVGHISNSGR